MISFEDFKKAELKIGTIRAAERVPNSEKLLKLHIDIGEANGRQIIAGIGKVYDPASLIGKQVTVIANLEPRLLMGLESQGMVLAADAETPVILMPEKEVPPGSVIK